jgi:diguanylate cyclase (GGDEF)-like protein
MTTMLMTKGCSTAVIDALSAHICILDREGRIVAVNRAWRNFGAANSPETNRSDVGTSYLQTCRDVVGSGADEARAFAAGIQSILDRQSSMFQLEYPCHSPTEFRWFLGRVTPLVVKERGAVISHINITDRKLLENELTRIASVDHLTDLPNRRHFLQVGNTEVERSRRFHSPASVVMIDLDHFKSVNDAHGHAAGDEALRRFARISRASLRQIDTLARMGGEEFAIILPGTDEAGAVVLAEKLRSNLEAMTIRQDTATPAITASFGVAQVSAFDQGIEDALGRADSALYGAKRAGRNCVMRFSTAAQVGSHRDAAY